MPRFTKTTDDGREIVQETAIPREAAALRSQGFKETKARTAEVRKAEAETAKPAEAVQSADAPKSSK